MTKKVKLYRRGNVWRSLIFGLFVGILLTYKNLKSVGADEKAKSFLVAYSIVTILITAIVIYLDNITMGLFSSGRMLIISLLVVSRIEKTYSNYVSPYKKEHKDNIQYHTVWATIKNIIFGLLLSLGSSIIVFFAVTPQAFDKSYLMCGENTIYAEDGNCYCKDGYSPKYFERLGEEICVEDL